MTLLNDFPEITRANEPLGPYTHLKLGGPVEFFVQPRSVEELVTVLRYCAGAKLPLKILGSGVNLLVRDEPLPGVVMRLSAPAFSSISVDGNRVKAGCGAGLPALISATARHG